MKNVKKGAPDRSTQKLKINALSLFLKETFSY